MIYVQFTNLGYDIFSLRISISSQLIAPNWTNIGEQTSGDIPGLSRPTVWETSINRPGKALASCPTPANASTAGEALIRRCFLLTCLNIQNYIIVTLNCNISLPCLFLVVVTCS